MESVKQFRYRITERNVALGLQGQCDLDSIRDHGYVKRPEHDGGIPLADLIGHVDKHYTVFQLQHDMDCVLSCARSDADRRELRRFARAKLAGKAVSDRSATCETCGGKFIARRSTARFCSAKCRQRKPAPTSDAKR